MKSMTYAAQNALAYLHVTGVMPKYLRKQTWWAVYQCVDRIPFDADRYPKDPRDYSVKDEHVLMVESHPMVVKVRELQAAGWKLDPALGRRKVNAGIWLIKPGLHRNMETVVWRNGKQGKVWGEPKPENNVASLTSENLDT